MTEQSLKRALEIFTTLNENTVTIPMVRQWAQNALDAHGAGIAECRAQAVKEKATCKVCKIRPVVKPFDNCGGSDCIPF